MDSRLLRYILAGLIIINLFVASCADDLKDAQAQKEVVVGALLSLTGNWSSLGIASEAAMEIAVEEVNAYFEELGANLSVKLIIEDTELLPEKALEKMKSLVEDQGAMIIIGPQSSSEASMVKDYADEKGVLVISQGSTAGSLSIAGDNLYRFCPDDSREGEAISELIWNDGIEAIIPVWRNDAGNIGLHDAVQNSYTSLGGAFYEGIRYDSSEVDFSEEVAAIRSQVDEAIALYGESAVGVYLAAFDEVVQLFNEAQKDATLSGLPWYGSDGVAMSNALVSDDVAAQFAVTTGYPNPIYGLDEQAKDKWEPLSEQIASETGQEPDAFALAAYDALWVAARAYYDSGETEDISTLKDYFVQASGEYEGATGATILNDAGDRALGNFDFWAICGETGNFGWEKAGSYQAESKEITFSGCP